MGSKIDFNRLLEFETDSCLWMKKGGIQKNNIGRAPLQNARLSPGPSKAYITQATNTARIHNITSSTLRKPILSIVYLMFK